MRSSSLVCLTLVKCGGRGFDSQLGQIFFRGVFRCSCVSCNSPQVLGFFLPQSSLLRLIKASGNCLWSVFVYLCRLHFCAAQHTHIYLFISVHLWGCSLLFGYIWNGIHEATSARSACAQKCELLMQIVWNSVFIFSSWRVKVKVWVNMLLTW